MMRLLPLVLPVLAAAASAQEYGEDYRLKIEVAGESRKVALFVPKGIKKNYLLPMVVAIPGDEGKAFSELGQWQQMGFEFRFAVVSVDVKTAARGWLPSEQLEMQRDAEAVVLAVQAAHEKAQEIGIQLDDYATVLTGFSGGTYLTLWLGIRRPDLFLAVCGRACLFHVEEAEFNDLDKVPPNFDMPIFVYRGAQDVHRSAHETELAKKTLEKAGWKNVTYKVVDKMQHESKPDVFVEWFREVLKTTEKARKERRKIADAFLELKEQVEQGKAGAYKKLADLAARERKFKVSAGAGDYLAAIEKEAAEKMAQAASLEADSQLIEAAGALKAIEKAYRGLPVSKKAKSLRVKIEKSDAYAAEELLVKAMEYREKGLDDKAVELLEKIVEKYPDTAAAARAKQLMDT